MTTIVLEIVTLFVLVLAGGTLAMSELAVVTARKGLLRQRAEDGDARAGRALALAESPGRFLSTVQIGITLVGVLAGAFGGATLARELATRLGGLPWIGEYAEALAVGLVVAGVTFASLLLGELVPKRIALRDPEGVAVRVAPWMERLARVARPLVAVLNHSSSLVLRALGLRPAPETPVTDEEIQVLLHEGAQAGVFEPIEAEIVGGLFRASDRPLAAMVTPRSEIDWIDEDATDDAILATLRHSGHGRYPVARSDLEQVLGIVRHRALIDQWLETGSFDLRAALRPALFVPETMPALGMLERFMDHRAKMALVIDEFGGLVGLVTINDVLGAIVGELPEQEVVEREALLREDGSWLVDGMVAVDELARRLGRANLREVFEGRYHTVGGLVMSALGRIPTEGEHVEREGIRVEVVDMDGRRVDKVLVELRETESERST